MYPNPAIDEITISERTEIVLNKVVIYELTGRLIKTIDFRKMGQEQNIDISFFAAGIYLIEIQGENSSVIKQLIKK